MSLCKYRNIFGVPEEGLHSYRLFNIAIIDLLATVIAAKIIEIYLGEKIGLNFWQILIILLIVGIVLHRMFCVRTTIDKLLFQNEE